MDKSIMPIESIDIVPFPTLEEFKASFSRDESYKSVLEKIADAYDKLPIYVKLLKNLDPTGCIIGCFADGLSEIKAKRNEEKLLKTLYELVKAICIIDQKLGRIDPEHFKSQVSALTEMYFDYSMRAYQLEKIETFRNAFVSGVIDYDRTFDEKENIFNIIYSLSIEQIRILKFIYDNRFNSNTVDREVIVRELRLTEPYVQQLCNDLIGKGLLIGNLGLIRIDGYGGYKSYYIGDYLETLIKYIKEPVDVNISINIKHS
jgi:hypothetical protein